MNQSDIDTLFKMWDSHKDKLLELESEIAKFKKAAERIMRKNGQDKIVGTDFILSRRTLTRQNICKKDIPSDIWDSYCTSSSYQAYYLKKKDLPAIKK